ncbi:MAG: AarF/UbiB family protein [Phycisphaerales bacterium]|nr:AarF/UbiB family protein [Phycisphaerales bacterium]
MTINPVSRRIQHVHRYAQLLEVLARHGFADLSQKLGLGSLIDRGRAVIGAAPRTNHEHVPVAARLRLAMQELGPTFVKLGQVMSTRADLVPPEWIEEFKKLQNNVPGVEYSVVEELLEEEFGGADGVRRLFKSIDKAPLAAGSMAQVHLAQLRSPEDGSHAGRVVLKVLRPGIRRVIAVDMEILHSLAELVETHFADLGYSPTEVVNEFAKELAREVDLMHEGRSTERLGAQFDGDAGVVFPMVYWEATTRNVLTMDHIEGTVLADLDPATLSSEDRRALVENGARAVFSQCLEHGFFHADPHPGNLIALKDGKGGAIAFIDCGMTGQVDTRTARQLADLVMGVVSGDLDKVMAAAGAITSAEQEKLDDRTLRADVHGIVSQFQGTPLDRLNLGGVLTDFFATLRRHRIRCPADIVLLIKALTTIESVGRDIDPTFEMVAFVRPYLDDLVRKRYSASAVRGRFERSALAYMELLEDLPGELRPFIAQLRKNKVGVNLEHRGLDKLTGTIEHASRNISFALIISAMFVGSSIIIMASRAPGMVTFTAVGIAGVVASVVLVVVMTISNRKKKSGRGG